MRINYGEILNLLEPEEVYMLLLNGNINKFPNHYWDTNDRKEKAKKCIKHLIENVLKWSDEEVLENFRYNTFHKYGLKNMVKKCFNDVYHEALCYTYPDKFKVWHFKTSPRNFYTKENTIKALQWEIENNLKYSKIKVKNIMGDNFMKNLKLYRGYQKHFNSSPYKILSELYNYKFKPTDLKKVPNRYWNLYTLIDEIIDIVERKDYTVKELVENWGRYYIEKNRLISPIDLLLKGDYVKALDITYPGIYQMQNIKPDLPVKNYSNLKKSF